MSKYIVAVSHKVGYRKDWSYLKLENTDKAMAFAEAAVKGFEQEEVYGLIVLKELEKNTYTRLARIFSNGVVYDATDESYLGDWIVLDNQFVEESK